MCGFCQFAFGPTCGWPVQTVVVQFGSAAAGRMASHVVTCAPEVKTWCRAVWLNDGLAAMSFGDQVREKVRGIVVSHRAEHGWQGRMHNDTAYGPVEARNGVHTVVTRKPLSGLTAKDFPNIRDTKLAEALEAHVAAEAAAGRTLGDALNSFTWGGQPVRRVRMLDVLGNPIPVHDPSGGVFKVYKGDSNAWYEILRDPRGRWIGRIVSTFEAYRLHREWLAETGGDSGKGGGVFLD